MHRAEGLHKSVDMPGRSWPNPVDLGHLAVGPDEAQKEPTPQRLLAWRWQKIEAFERLEREAADVFRAEPSLAKQKVVVGQGQHTAAHRCFEQLRVGSAHARI